MLIRASYFIRAFIILDTLIKLKGQLQYEPPRCADGFLQCYNTCYFVSNKTASWYEASNECKELKWDSNLLSLNSKLKDQNFRKCMQTSQTAKELWIDGIFDAKLKRWIWGRTAEPLLYQAFSRKNFSDDSEWKCIALNQDLLYRWSSRDCFSTKPFVCEIETKT